MSVLSIAPYFPFRRIKIVKQTVLPNTSEWSKSRCRAQLDPAQRAGSEHDGHPSVAYLSLSQAVVSSLSSYQYRGFRAVSSLSASDYPLGSLHSPIVSVYDRNRSRQPCGAGLEDGQKYRQSAFRRPIWTTRLRGAAHSGRRRNCCPQGLPLSDRSDGLPQRPYSLCRQRSQGQNLEQFFQPVDGQTAKKH